LPAGEGEALVGGLVGEDDGGVVELVLGEALDAVADGEQAGEEDGDDGAGGEGGAGTGELAAEGAGAGEGDGGVEEAEQQAGADQAEVGQEGQGEQQGGEQRADVVEGEDAGDQVLELLAVLEDAHEQGDLEADHGADEDEDREQERADGAEVGVAEEQAGGREPADDGDDQLDGDEAVVEVALDRLAEPRAEAHRAEVDADDEAELGDGVAEQVAGHRRGDELVDEAAGGDDEHGGEQEARARGRAADGVRGGLEEWEGHARVLAGDGGGDDDRDADDQRAEDDAEGGVLVLLDLLADAKRGDADDDDPGEAEQGHAEGGEGGGGDEVVEHVADRDGEEGGGRWSLHGHFPPWYPPPYQTNTPAPRIVPPAGSRSTLPRSGVVVK
jgi:hypothetical protein